MTEEQINAIWDSTAKQTVPVNRRVAFAQALLAVPMDMLLYCPRCGVQHIDRADTPEDGADWNNPEIAWANPPHKSHLCLSCNFIWRPSDRPTNGVAEIKTKGKDDWPLKHPVLVPQTEKKCCVCGTTEGLHKDGWHGYRCGSDDCMVF